MISLNEQHLLSSKVCLCQKAGSVLGSICVLRNKQTEAKLLAVCAQHHSILCISATAMDCDDVISVCDTERSSCTAAAAEDERSTAVSDLQSAIKVSEQELAIYKQQLSDAGLTKVLSLLSSNLETLAVQADSPLLVVKSTEVALRLKKQQQQLQEMQEQYRVRSVLQTLSSGNERENSELAPIRKRHADIVLLIKAQLQVQLDNYLTATPYYLISLKGWQVHAQQLRNKPSVDLRRMLTTQLCAYKAQLDALRDEVAASAVALHNALPKATQQHFSTAGLTAAALKAIDARDALLAKAQQLVDKGTEPDIKALNASLAGSMTHQMPSEIIVLQFPISADAIRPFWEVTVASTLKTLASCTPPSATYSSRPVTSPSLLPLPKLSFKSCKTSTEADVLSCDSATIWSSAPNDHWSPLHHQFVLAAWTAYEQETGRTA
jgi:hypothetical protein